MGGAVSRREAGFTLVEVVVAFAIVAMVLAGLYSLMAGALRGEAGAAVRNQALAAARAHLESIGIEQPLTAGETTGVYATGVPWRLAIEPVETLSYRGQAFRVVLEPLSPTGKPLARFETFKLVPRTNRRE
jgi:prepilin-type N-terminal cleavage/methylation domain-containing protein